MHIMLAFLWGIHLGENFFSLANSFPKGLYQQQVKVLVAPHPHQHLLLSVFPITVILVGGLHSPFEINQLSGWIKSQRIIIIKKRISPDISNLIKIRIFQRDSYAL